MKALPVQPEPLWRTDFRERIVVSLWFLPTIFAVAAIAAANLTIWLDARVDAPIGVRPDLVSDPGSAATFAGAIAAATLAFVAVVFATTLVAIQLAASQYSPRTVRIFIRSRVTRVTLGLFLVTFVFSVIVLVSNRAPVTSAAQFAPVVSVSTLMALTVATVFGFVAYLHGVVRLMRVQYLLETIATESRHAIEENFPPASAYVDAEPPLADPSPRRLCHTGPAGVITATDLGGLAELCGRNQCWLELTVGVGEYLAHGTPVALAHGGDLREGDVSRFFLIGGERTFRPDPTGLRVDASGTVRVKRKLRNFDALLVLALTEVIRYGADAPQVVRRLRGMLDELQSTLPADRQAAIARQRSLLEAAAGAALPAPFTEVASAADREGLG
jgi:uncharacterized membrane protein